VALEKRIIGKDNGPLSGEVTVCVKCNTNVTGRGEAGHAGNFRESGIGNAVGGVVSGWLDSMTRIGGCFYVLGVLGHVLREEMGVTVT